MPERKFNKKSLLVEFIRNFFIQNYFIAFCAAAWYLSSLFLYSVNIEAHHIAMCLVLYIGTLLMYNLDRIFGDHWNEFKIFFKTSSSDTQSYQKIFAKIKYQFLLVALMIPIVINLLWSQIFLLSGIALLAITYALPILPKGKRLREVPFLKIFQIAFTWSLLCGVLPLLNQVQYSDLILITSSKFLFIYAITIPFDIRDIIVDSANNMKTIPGIFGIRKAKLLGLLALLIDVVISSFNASEYATAHVWCVILAVILIFFWKSSVRWWYYLLLLDGTILIDSLLIYYYSI